MSSMFDLKQFSSRLRIGVKLKIYISENRLDFLASGKVIREKEEKEE